MKSNIIDKENEKPLISIIVPIYNAEIYLDKCIKSILNQSYDNFELILVNDGSADNSANIVKKYMENDKRIIYLNQKQSGVSAARNNGINNAHGDFITFIDADDMIEKDYLEYLLSLFSNRNIDVTLSTFPFKIKNDSKKNKQIMDDKVNEMSGIDATKEMLLYKIVISSWNKMFKTELIKNKKIMFNENLSYGEGFEFVIKSFLASNRVAIGKRHIYDYRVDNKNSAMTVFKEKLVTGSLESQKYILKEIKERYKNNLIVLNNLIKAWNYSYWHTNCDCLNTIYGSKSQRKYKKMTKKISRNCRKGLKNISNKEVPNIDKIKIMLYFISPSVASKIINKLRKRKFNKNV